MRSTMAEETKTALITGITGQDGSYLADCCGRIRPRSRETDE
jgi:hypothetical protein